ncbi:hypothetical protein GCM10023259_024510 [Thermocatellispora tengchongensis]
MVPPGMYRRYDRWRTTGSSWIGRAARANEYVDRVRGPSSATCGCWRAGARTGRAGAPAAGRGASITLEQADDVDALARRTAGAGGTAGFPVADREEEGRGGRGAESSGQVLIISQRGSG